MRNFCFLLLFCLGGISVFAQERELGGGGGIAGYIGDINPRNPLKFSGQNATLFFRYNASEYSSFRSSFSVATINAFDSDSKDEFQKLRNLSFQTNIIEASEIYEFNFLPFIPRSDDARISPYLFGGISIFYFDPQAQLNGTSYHLHDMHTEGQGLPGGTSAYSLFALAIPYGMGIKFNIYKNLSVAAELNYRFCFTDYLDDISGVYADNTEIKNKYGEVAAKLADRSGEINDVQNTRVKDTQRGDSRGNDLFMTFGIHLSYTIIPYRCPSLKKVYKRDYYF